MNLAPANRLEHAHEYYFSRKQKELSRLKASGVDVINLGIGNPDLPPPAHMQEQLAKLAMLPTGHGYQGYTGIEALREAIAEWYLRHFGVTLCRDSEVFPLMGSKEGIMHISMAYLNPGDRVLIPNPGYPTYIAATHIAGATPVPYPLLEENGFQPNIQDLERMELDRVKIMWVNYPNMPTGAEGSMSLFQALIDFGRKYNILICHDNPYCFIQNANPLSILQVEGAREHAVELNSLSKSYNMAGWRVGMLVGNQEVIHNVLRFKSNMDSGMPYPVQMAAVAALGTDNGWFATLNREYSERRAIAVRIGQSIGCTLAKGSNTGMFVWLRIPEHAQGAEALSDLILRVTGVFITPGTVFGSNGQRYLRISLCSTKELLTKALDRLNGTPLNLNQTHHSVKNHK